MRREQLLSIIALISYILVLTGCIATHRSNTAWHDETTTVGILYPQEMVDSGHLRGKLVGTGLAVSAAEWALSEALKWEAGKYLNDSKGKLLEANLLNSDKATAPGLHGEGWTLPKDRNPLAYITFIRTVHPKENMGFWESVWKTLLWYERPTELEPWNSAAEHELVDRVKACTNLTSDSITEAYGFDNIKKGSHLGFMALLQITPTEPKDAARNSLNYHIELVDYRYSSLKAKNMSWIRIPFTDWEDTKSFLKITLQGPMGDSRLAGGQYSPSTEFQVEWNRESSGNAQPSKWKNDPYCSRFENRGTQSPLETFPPTLPLPKTYSSIPSPLKTSLPFKAFDLRNINIYLQLVEASSLKDAFDLVSKKAGDIDAKKLLKIE